MNVAPRIPEIAQRDRFVRRVARDHVAYAIGEGGRIVVTPSPRYAGRDVALIWASRQEAERWAGLLAAAPEIMELDVGTLIADVLPAIAARQQLAGLDWTIDPVDAEIDPTDLARRLLAETLDTTAAAIRSAGEVFLLEDDDGLALLASARCPGRRFLPCWTNREQAQARMTGEWAGMRLAIVPVADFVARTLPWLDELGWHAAPGHMETVAPLEIEPRHLLARLQPAPPAR